MERTRTIGIDCRFAASHSGLGRYTRELVTHLLKRADPVQYVLFLRADERSWIPEQTNTQYVTRNTSYPHYSLSEQLHFPRIIYTSRLDLFFSPHFNIPVLTRVPFVVTIHDLILHRYPNQASLPRRLAYRFLMVQAVRRARDIIAVSNFTKSELIQTYGERIGAKCTMIGEAVGDTFTPPSENEHQRVLTKHGLQKPFFLYVGNAKEHKNVQTLIDARALLPADAPGLVLVTGGPEAERLVMKQGTRRMHFVDDADLPALYSAAQAFVTASLYEGFCLPAIEALACGCPVIAPHTTAIAELPGDIRWTEPTPQAIAAAMSAPLPRPAAHHYGSWQAAAAATATVLRKALAP